MDDWRLPGTCPPCEQVAASVFGFFDTHNYSNTTAKVERTCEVRRAVQNHSNLSDGFGLLPSARGATAGSPNDACNLPADLQGDCKQVSG